VEQPTLECEVKMGAVCVCRGDGRADRERPRQTNLVTFGVGSCLVITLFDAKKKIGALAHAMLPTRGARTKGRSGKYVDTAIEEMVEQMQSLGSDGKHLEAKLIGAANMFSGLSPEISTQNVTVAKKKLKDNGIELIAESTGGGAGRSVALSVSSGVVTIKIKF
jgi:chemotaxis protein CheD